MYRLLQRTALIAAVVFAPASANALTLTGFLNPSTGDGNTNLLSVGGSVGGNAFTDTNGEAFVFSSNFNDAESGAPVMAGDDLTGTIVAQENLTLNLTITVNPPAVISSDILSVFLDTEAAGGGDLFGGAFEGELSFSGAQAIFPTEVVLLAGDVLRFTIQGSGDELTQTFINFSGPATAAPVPLPPAAFLLLAGVGGIALMRRRA